MKKRAKQKESVCVIDIETRSPSDIKQGPARYFAPPGAAIICIGYAIDSGPVKTAWLLNGAPLPAAVLNHKGLFVAHNWFFEYSAFLRFYPGTRLAVPSNWLCTQALARRLQVGSSRASLHEVCEALSIPSPKSDETKRLIQTYSIPCSTDRADGAPWFTVPTVADKKLWLEYVASDVTAEREAWQLMSPHWSEAERAVFAVDTVQQARGVPIDVKGALALQAKLNAAKESAAERAEQIAGRNSSGTLILSGRDEFLKWLKDKWGVVLPNAQAATLAAFEDENEINDDLAEALAIRSLLQSRATGKAQKLLDLQHGGRVYKPSEYHLAHTGRWQSWGANFFNFSRKAVEPDEWERSLAAARNVRDFAPLMRGLVMAPKGKTLITTDWRGIENYLSLFYAQDAQQLKRVEAGESQYLIFGETLFQRKITKADATEYALAKMAVLGLGYGSGAVTFARVAKVQAGLDIAADEAQRIVNVWRATNRAVVESWRAVERCFRAALAGQPFYEWRGFTFASPRAGLVIITLPNGYDLRYPHAAVSSSGELYYAPQGKPKKIYGGKIWENLMQCLGGQLLRGALVTLEGMQNSVLPIGVILHVYDEIVAEAKTAYAKRAAAAIAGVMTRAPVWAPEMKLEVEQKISKRWGK